MSGPWERFQSSEAGPWAKFQSGAAEQPSMVEDLGKSAASGLESGTISTLGAAGDLRRGLSAATDWAGGKLGLSPNTIQSVKNVASEAANLAGPVGIGFANAPSSADIASTVTNPVVDPNYQPQTKLGEYAKTTAEFAPGLALGGEGGLGRRVLTNVVAPAVASETAGQLTKGTAAEPYARIAGAGLGGGAALAVERALAQRAATKAAQAALPSGEELVKTGSGQFDRAREMDLVLQPGFAQETAKNMRAAVKDFDPEAQKAVFNVIDRVENMGKPQAPNITSAQRLQAEMNWEKLPATPPALPVEMNNIELARKQLSKLRVSNDPSTRSAAKAAQDALTESQMALSPTETLTGNAADYVKTLREAVGNYGAGKRAQTIEGKMNLAELNLNSPVGGLDMASKGQALQRTMKQLARPVNNTNVPIARKLGFNNEEVAAITRAANGNNLTHLGDVANHVIPHWMGGGVASAVLRAMGGMSVKRQVSALDSLVRSRSPLAAQVASGLPANVVNRLPARTQRLLTTARAASVPIKQLVVQPSYD